MFTISNSEIDCFKENGLYDYLIEMEDLEKISLSDKETIYQYILANSKKYMSQDGYSKFVDGLVNVLKMKKGVDCFIRRLSTLSAIPQNGTSVDPMFYLK